MNNSPDTVPEKSPVRLLYLALGWLFMGLGLLGVILPVLPTTPFLLLALWAFSRSSKRLHNWLYNHPKFGPGLQRWHQHRIIPLHAKVIAITGMGASLVYITGFSELHLAWVVATIAIMTIGATYVLTRPSSIKAVQRTSD